MPLPSPILAAGFEGLVAVAFLVISVIGWVINQAGGQNNPGAKPGAGPRPQPKRQQVQNEIDMFLQQATGKRPARGNAGMIAEDEIEVIEEGPQRRPVAPERRPLARQQPRPQPQRVAKPQPQRPQPQRPQQARPQPQSVRTPTPAVAPRTTGTSLGMGVRQHVATHMADQISQHVAQDVPNSIDVLVQQHLGTSSGDATTRPGGASNITATIAAEMRDRDTIRRAIVVNEILSPPLSRRSRG